MEDNMTATSAARPGGFLPALAGPRDIQARLISRPARLAPTACSGAIVTTYVGGRSLERIARTIWGRP
jgi:hypothetical protein